MRLLNIYEKSASGLFELTPALARLVLMRQKGSKQKRQVLFLADWPPKTFSLSPSQIPIISTNHRLIRLSRVLADPCAQQGDDLAQWRW
jgi:hypothetical protein